MLPRKRQHIASASAFRPQQNESSIPIGRVHTNIRDPLVRRQQDAVIDLDPLKDSLVRLPRQPLLDNRIGFVASPTKIQAESSACMFS